jgi:hypothetical protein
MLAENSRNWLLAAQCLVLPTATFVAVPAALAQSAPVPPAPAGSAAPSSGFAPRANDVAPSAPVAPVQEVAPAAPVAAAPPASEAPALSPDAADEHGKKHKHDKKDKKDKNGDKEPGKKGKSERSSGAAVTTAAGRIQLKGRVFALAELQHREHIASTGPGTSAGLVGYNALDLSLESARIGLEYEAPVRWLSAVVEIEVSGKPSLKDGFIQARGQHFFARAGQFKLPTAALETESPWTLPLARRGFVHDLLTDWLDVGGRRPGVMAGWRGRGGLRPRFMVGAFQGSIQSEVSVGDRNTDLIEQSSLEAQSYVARAQFEPADIQVGGWYEHRVGSPNGLETKHYMTGGLDAVVDRVLPGGGIRAWVEGSSGTSWYEHSQKPKDDKDAIFVTGRALVAYRFGGTVDEAAYVEPFGFFGVLEPDTEVRRDLAWEAAVGVNAGLWRLARLTLQGEINRAQRNFPVSYLGGAEPDRMGLLLQAGVAW